jgi:hypothetical protein
MSTPPWPTTTRTVPSALKPSSTDATGSAHGAFDVHGAATSSKPGRTS